MRAVQIGDYFLAGDPSKSSRQFGTCEGFRISGQRAQQRLSGGRWATNRFIDRGARSITIQFNTLRRFATVEEALLFCMDYPSAHEWSGTVTLTAHDGTQYELSDAVIQRPVRVPQGEAVLLSYLITGKALTLIEEEGGDDEGED